MTRTLVVLVGLVVAAAAGAAGALWGAPRLAGFLALGLVPVMWGIVSLIERSTGRALWRFAAPYPYGSMLNEGHQQPDSPPLPTSLADDRDASTRRTWEQRTAA